MHSKGGVKKARAVPQIFRGKAMKALVCGRSDAPAHMCIANGVVCIARCACMHQQRTLCSLLLLYFIDVQSSKSKAA